jgi:hypothetical protein
VKIRGLILGKIFIVILSSWFILSGCEEAIAPDLEPPTVIITFPEDGAAVSGVITVVSRVSDNQGIAFAEFWVNDTLLQERRYLEPYFFQLNTSGYNDYTSLELKVRVYDAFFNFCDDKITVSVFNDQP